MTRRFTPALELSVLLAGAFLLPALLTPTLVALAQAAGATPPTVTNETGEWGASVVYAWLASSGLEFLKRKPWFGVMSTKTTWGMQRAIGIALASATALGIHWNFDATAGTLMITGLYWEAIKQNAFEWLRQFVFQEIVYRTTIKNYLRGDLKP